MPIFIAKDYNGKTQDLVLARNVELATAYWHGKDIIPHTTREYSENDLVDHPTGVLPLIATRVRSIMNDSMVSVKIREVI